MKNDGFYGAVVESIADGTAITVRTKRASINRAYLKIHGLRDESEVLGHDLDRFVLPEDRRAVTERVLARQRVELQDDIVEYRIRLAERSEPFKPRQSPPFTRESVPQCRLERPCGTTCTLLSSAWQIFHNNKGLPFPTCEWAHLSSRPHQSNAPFFCPATVSP
jgi:PAS domain-containing protein